MISQLAFLGSYPGAGLSFSTFIQTLLVRLFYFYVPQFDDFRPFVVQNLVEGLLGLRERVRN